MPVRLRPVDTGALDAGAAAPAAPAAAASAAEASADLIPAVRVRASRVGRMLRGEAGSSPAEFVMVGTLLTALALGVLQFGLGVYVRNVIHDAAVEGAYHGALADRAPADGAARTRALISRTVGGDFAQSVTAVESSELGHVTVRVDVEATIPLAGLWGVPRALRVSAEAPKESFHAR